MKLTSFILFLFSIHLLSAQVINPNLDEWVEVVDPNMRPFFNPVGWNSTNLPAFSTNNNNPNPAITVSRENEEDRAFARIESLTPSIDATSSGYMEQRISIQNVQSITYTSRCDSIELLGRCVVQLYTDNSFSPEFSDSTAVVSDDFIEQTILIDPDLFGDADSVFLRFMAFGNDFFLEPELEGHAVFDIDEVRVDFISSTKQAILNDDVLRIYPNPSKQIFNVEMDVDIVPNSIMIYDLLGRQIDTIPFETEIDLSFLGSGTYLITIETDKGLISKKLTVL